MSFYYGDHSIRFYPTESAAALDYHRDNIRTNAEIFPEDCPDTWERWHLIPKEKPVFAPPGTEDTFVTVPGRHGTVNLTRYTFGKPIYKERSGSVTFLIDPDYIKHRPTIYSDMLKYFQGKERLAVLKDDRYYFYRGTFTVQKITPDKAWDEITLEYDLYPFKFERWDGDLWLWDDFDFETGVIRDYLRIAETGTDVVVDVRGLDKKEGTLSVEAVPGERLVPINLDNPSKGPFLAGGDGSSLLFEPSPQYVEPVYESSTALYPVDEASNHAAYFIVSVSELGTVGTTVKAYVFEYLRTVNGRARIGFLMYDDSTGVWERRERINMHDDPDVGDVYFDAFWIDAKAIIDGEFCVVRKVANIGEYHKTRDYTESLNKSRSHAYDQYNVPLLAEHMTFYEDANKNSVISDYNGLLYQCRFFYEEAQKYPEAAAFYPQASMTPLFKTRAEAGQYAAHESVAAGYRYLLDAVSAGGEIYEGEEDEVTRVLGMLCTAAGLLYIITDGVVYDYPTLRDGIRDFKDSLPTADPVGYIDQDELKTVDQIYERCLNIAACISDTGIKAGTEEVISDNISALSALTGIEYTDTGDIVDDVSVFFDAILNYLQDSMPPYLERWKYVDIRQDWTPLTKRKGLEKEIDLGDVDGDSVYIVFRNNSQVMPECGFRAYYRGQML